MKKIIWMMIILAGLVNACSQYTAQQNASDQPEENIIVAEPVTGPTAEEVPTADFVPPTGYQEYIDQLAQISIFIPEEWIISQTIEGQYAILQSYPEDKYVGGEPRQPGDTKCDLIFKNSENADEIVQQWTNDDLTTVVSDGSILLRDGIQARKLVLDSMGRSTSIFADIETQVVILTCYGEFGQFDTIAATIGAISN